MKVIKGKYRSASAGLVDAVLVQIDLSNYTIVANLGGIAYTSIAMGDFIREFDDFKEEKAVPVSTVFPKVTDFFNQELLEMTIKFKG